MIRRPLTPGPSRHTTGVLAVPMLLLVMGLVACDRRPVAEEVATTPLPQRSEMPGIPASGVDMSVPSASQALSSGPAADAAPTADGNGPNQKASVSSAQESQSMPLPGQANDHSNTVTEDKKPAPASAPAR